MPTCPTAMRVCTLAQIEMTNLAQRAIPPRPAPPLNTVTGARVPSDYDAVLEERATRGQPTNGYRPPRGKDWHLAGDNPAGQAGARVWLREVWPPALGPPGDDVFDLDPRWRQ
jgi:hypothetical protein